ncbi:MAG: hypothetical protein IPP78_02935 [Holophagaceae bacterium]|nr:hypothetical protein [Holophagaceae bacterium]
MSTGLFMMEPFPVVRTLDHVMIEAEDPTVLLRLFVEGFGLPVAWEFGDYGDLWSGGVCAGNLNLEFCRFKEKRFGKPDIWEGADGGARLGGLAFESTMPISEAVSMLAGWGVPFGSGIASENWTELEIQGLLDAPGIAFLVEYNFDHDAWQGGHRDAFAASGGGSLGLVGVQEIQIGVRDPQEATPAWGRFLCDIPKVDAAAWRLAEQLALRLVPWGKDEIASLMLRVKSVETTMAFLKDAGIPALESLDGVALDPAVTQGLHFQLVDSGTPAFWES